MPLTKNAVNYFSKTQAYINDDKMLLSIEEEESVAGFYPHGGCNTRLGPESIPKRLDRIIEIENKYHFRFKGIHFRGFDEYPQDLIETNREGINNLIEHFENGA